MDQRDSIERRPRSRRDGWAPERQLRFLGVLARTRSVTKAARAAGMSRESAYRLRTRSQAALFAAIWDRALRQSESHKVGARRSRHRSGRSPIFRANPAKVTKLVKFATPGFDPTRTLAV